MKNLQISIEGSARSGKTTLAALLAVLLERCGCQVSGVDSSGDQFEEIKAGLAHNPEGTLDPFQIDIQVSDTPAKKVVRKKSPSNADIDIFDPSPFANPIDRRRP